VSSTKFLIERHVDIEKTPRVLQLEGLFDVPPSERSSERWEVTLDLDFDWNIGLVVGPSGSGKTTLVNELFPGEVVDGWQWPDSKSVLDGFPPGMPVRDIVDLLSSVGFSSPPSWLRPYRVLSTGEKFRVDMARTLAEKPAFSVVDEFTSVVDRTVAQIGSAAIAKSVRRRGQKFIAVSCHYDVIDWLCPDWIYEPHTNRLERGSLRRRPDITLVIQRVHHSAWELFRKHHYLDTSLHKSAHCFVATWNDVPVAFSSWLASPGHRDAYREHRTVCLPDYQGVGIGNAVSDACASIVKAVGKRPISATSHPAMIRSRARSKNWKLVRSPSMTKRGGKLYLESGLGKRSAMTRLTAGFAYVGPAMDRSLAACLWASEK